MGNVTAIGREVWQTLAAAGYSTLDKILAASENDFAAVPGIGPDLAARVVSLLLEQLNADLRVTPIAPVAVTREAAAELRRLAVVLDSTPEAVLVAAVAAYRRVVEQGCRKGDELRNGAAASGQKPCADAVIRDVNGDDGAVAGGACCSTCGEPLDRGGYSWCPA